MYMPVFLVLHSGTGVEVYKNTQAYLYDGWAVAALQRCRVKVKGLFTMHTVIDLIP